MHRSEPDTSGSGRGDPGAVVFDVDDELLVLVDRHMAMAGAGVAGGVGHRFDRDPVGGELDRRGDPSQISVVGDVDGEAVGVGAETHRLPADGFDETEVVECRRSEVIDKAADVGDGLVDLGLEVAEQRRQFGVVVESFGGGTEAQRHRRQGGSEAIVEVAPDASPFRLASLEEDRS